MIAQYIYHEADTGVIDIAREALQYLHDWNVGILTVDVPRAFCDLNRPRELATPESIASPFWDDVYTQAMGEIEEVLARSQSVLQLHSMNNFDPIRRTSWDDISSDQDILDHLENTYS